MPNAISNTSPLLYLYRIGAIEWLSQLFKEFWIPAAVFDELKEKNWGQANYSIEEV